MNDRLIDMLHSKALKTTGDVFVTLNPASKNWNLGDTSNPGDVQSHVIDRSDLKASITSAVTELSALLPAPTDY
jgi:hypothetical protein